MAVESRLAAQERGASGSAEVRRLRRDGWLPCIMYNSRRETRMIQVRAHDFASLLKHHRGESMMVDLEVEGEDKRKVLLKDVQHHPVTDDALHADFQEVSMTEKMHVAVPLVCVGECPGVTLDGGVLDHALRELEVECLPVDMPESIEVDISALRLGHTIPVREMVLPAGVSLVGDVDQAVVSVHAQRVIEEPAAEEAEAVEEGAEPEVIGEKTEESKEGQ